MAFYAPDQDDSYVYTRIILFILQIWGTRWCCWLRHCVTSQKVMGSVPDGVTGIFHWH